MRNWFGVPRRLGRLALFGVLVGAPMPWQSAVAAACPGTIQFDNSAGTSLWQTPSNWDLDRLPTSTDDVCIPAGLPATLSSGSHAVNSVDGGTLTISGGSLTVTGPSHLGGLNLTGGALVGPGDLTVDGMVGWGAGSMSGAGVTRANGGMSIGNSTAKDLAGRTLQVSGPVNQFGPISMWTGATIQNYGTWSVAQSGLTQLLTAFSKVQGGPAYFANQAGATFTARSTDGTIDVQVQFDNFGTLSVNGGTLSLRGGGSGAGRFTGASTATLRFATMGYEFSPGSSLDTVKVSVDSTLDVHGSFSATQTGVSGTARFHVDAPSPDLGITGIYGGLDLNTGDPVHMATLYLGSGTARVQATDTVNISGLTTWDAGTMDGSGETYADGGITLRNGGGKVLNAGRILHTDGTSTWTSGQLFVGTGSSIHNHGIWDVKLDATLTDSFAGGGFFNEAGAQFLKSAGTGNCDIWISFFNAGIVRSLAGSLRFIAPYVQSSGLTSLEGGTIESQWLIDIQGGTLAGSGSMATGVTMAGNLAPGLSPGQFTLGSYSQSPTGSFDVELGGLQPGTQFDTVTISGTASLAGALHVSLVNGFEPANFDTFRIMSFASSTGSFASVLLPTLPGDLRWAVRHNAGSIELQALSDLDGDGIGNAADCAPGDAGAWSAPAEVTGVQFGSDQQTLAWESLASQAGTGIAYDVVRGLLEELATGGGASQECLSSGSGGAQAVDGSVPALGYYYLVRGSNVCGDGTYGTSSSGVTRTSLACP